MAPPPPDSLIAALLAAVLGVVAPVTGFVITVLEPAPTTACSPAAPAAWEAQAQQLADQLARSGSTDAQSLRQQLGSAGVTPHARDLVAPTTSPGAPSAGWQELAAKLSGELADSEDPEAQKLAQAIGDTGTPTSRPRSTAVPGTSAPGAARPMPGDQGEGDASAAPTSASRTPSRPATPVPSSAPARSGSGPCPVPSGRGTPAPDRPDTESPNTESPNTESPDTESPSTRSPATRSPATGSRSTTRPVPTARSGDQRWEQLAGELAAALAGATDPRAAILQDALEQAGIAPATPSSRARTSAPRTTAIPVPDDPGDGG